MHGFTSSEDSVSVAQRRRRKTALKPTGNLEFEQEEENNEQGPLPEKEYEPLDGQLSPERIVQDNYLLDSSRKRTEKGGTPDPRLLSLTAEEVARITAARKKLEDAELREQMNASLRGSEKTASELAQRRLEAEQELQRVNEALEKSRQPLPEENLPAPIQPSGSVSSASSVAKTASEKSGGGSQSPIPLVDLSDFDPLARPHDGEAEKDKREGSTGSCRQAKSRGEPQGSNTHCATRSDEASTTDFREESGKFWRQSPETRQARH